MELEGLATHCELMLRKGSGEGEEGGEEHETVMQTITGLYSSCYRLNFCITSFQE